MAARQAGEDRGGQLRQVVAALAQRGTRSSITLMR
jgi:hypothetical protein